MFHSLCATDRSERVLPVPPHYAVPSSLMWAQSLVLLWFKCLRLSVLPVCSLGLLNSRDEPELRSRYCPHVLIWQARWYPPHHKKQQQKKTPAPTPPTISSAQPPHKDGREGGGVTPSENEDRKSNSRCHIWREKCFATTCWPWTRNGLMKVVERFYWFKAGFVFRSADIFAVLIRWKLAKLEQIA